MSRPIQNVVGFDDGPFAADHRGDVALVGVIYTQLRMDWMVVGRVRRDGRNATERVAELVASSRFNERLVMLSGIAFAGFNVVDIHALHEQLGLPVLVVARRQPNMRKIERALLDHVPGGARKWGLIQKAGAMEACAGVWVQRAGLTLKSAARVLRDTRVHGKLPEPLRVAHLIAGAVVEGHSRGGA